MSQKLGHSFGHLGWTSSPRGQTLSPRAGARWPKLGPNSRHFGLPWPTGVELDKMSFTIIFVYENYKF